ncbi:hypothetical protein EDWATA_01941 [Edwardsiella tarda ATCC 23685]|uniref:Uncharacterized protein n=1 Tax=Edwardsiella tarda ATCC 23685 TaxID=500638 RepID=D4F5B3_EDWTA|nr:hypothetical protein EDWATA_01941 [Edwardsiella tarda ATCC 23685]
MFVYMAMTIGEKDFLGCVITLAHDVIINSHALLEFETINAA